MKDTVADTEWLTPSEAAELFRIHVSTIYRWGEKGKIRLYQVGKRCTRLNRSEIEKLVKEKQNSNTTTPDTIFKRLSTVFWSLAQKHHLGEKEAKEFLNELLTGLSSREYYSHRSFNQTLEAVRDAFEQLVESKMVDEFQRSLSIFALEVEALSFKLDGQPVYWCHLAVLLPIVVRAWRKSHTLPPKAQISAAKALLAKLEKYNPTFEDVTECTDKLEAAGIRTLPSSPALADALIGWTDEGFPGREYGDDILRDIDTDSEINL